MRKLILMAILTAAGLPVLASSASADPYKWCALYSMGRGGGAQNCYFVTLEQCRAAVSGVFGTLMCVQRSKFASPSGAEIRPLSFRLP